MDTNNKMKMFKALHLISGLILAPLWAWFAYRHLTAFAATREPAYLFLFLSETVTVVSLAIRTFPKSISSSPLDWIVAIIGTFSTLCFAPEDSGILPSGKYAVAAGTLLQVFSMASLNRSFALVASTRRIKTQGMYRLIRHPIYASYLVTFTGYVLANTSRENIGVYLIAMACMFIRIFREEKHLAQDAEYRSYMKQVPYRVIPLVL
jgi:protein-S-isoprenylcysteine O-methyltransferase Ste14